MTHDDAFEMAEQLHAVYVEVKRDAYYDSEECYSVEDGPNAVIDAARAIFKPRFVPTEVGVLLSIVRGAGEVMVPLGDCTPGMIVRHRDVLWTVGEPDGRARTFIASLRSPDRPQGYFNSTEVDVALASLRSLKLKATP